MKKRDIGSEILEGVKAIKEGKGKRFKVAFTDSQQASGVFVKLTKYLKINKRNPE